MAFMDANALGLRETLEGFTGTEHYYKFLGGLVFTDGVKYLIEQANCFWLLTLIASYQRHCLKDKMLREMQFWTVRATAKGTAVVTCDRDKGDEAIRQDIQTTDFPLEEVRIWVELGSVDGVNPAYVAMLPSER